jgi:hypothetical protein
MRPLPVEGFFRRGQRKGAYNIFQIGSHGVTGLMQYTIDQLSDLDVVEVKATGVINTDVAKNMVIEAGIATASRGGQRCLFDLTDTVLDANQTLSGMYMFIEAFKLGGFRRSTKIAALVKAVDEHRKQLENSANFEGFNLKHFTDRKIAMDWLYS